MFIELRRCRACERQTVHRLLEREELSEDLRARAWQVAGVFFEHVSMLICATCQRWTLHAQAEFDPGPAHRAHFDIVLQEKSR